MILKECNRCKIYTPEGKPLTEADVHYAQDHIMLFFDEYPLPNERIMTTVDFYDVRAGLIRTVCALRVRENAAFYNNSRAWVANCVIKKVVDTVQRQQDIRVRTYIGAYFDSKNHGTFFGTIRNLSAGGIYMTALQLLDRNEMLSFRCNFSGGEYMFQARTLRMSRVLLGEQKGYGYGCCFVNLKDNAEAAVRKYVFKRLREERQGQK